MFGEIKHILAFVTLIVLTWFYPLPVTELFFGKNCSWVGGSPDLGLKLPAKALLFAKGSFMFLLGSHMGFNRTINITKSPV